MKEIIFYGRGGQGMVSAVGLLVSAIGRDGKYAQAFPYFGFERRGALARAFLRIDRDPILSRGFIKQPDCIVVGDPRLPKFVNITDGLKEKGMAVLNSKYHPDEVNMNVKLSKVGTIDASKIAETIYGIQTIPFTNYIMIGAFAATSGWVKIELILDAIRIAYEGDIAKRNERATREGYSKVEISINKDEESWLS